LKQWGPFLPKGWGAGGLIQVDIGGHPPNPLAQNTIFHLGSFSTIFLVPNFWGHFEALNDVFWTFGGPWVSKGFNALVLSFGFNNLFCLFDETLDYLNN
jgi:hypothetical protein